MDEKLLNVIVALGTATVGLAIVAVVVSNNSNTTGVIDSLLGGYANILSTAVSPVSSSSNG